MVHYSQQDPLYAAAAAAAAAANISAKIDYDAGGGGWGAAPSGVGVATDYGVVPDTYGAPPPSSYLRPDYYGANNKEPEPIIEIIIKESNESLPAPPQPPPPAQPARPAKEPVQVFYVKYKKNPNAYGDKDDIIYEKPVPAITPLAAAETTAEASGAGDGYGHGHGDDAAAYATAVATEPSPAYGYAATAGPPPAPSTTYRTIIKPDSEVYHGTGLKVTFGKSEASWGGGGGGGELDEAQKRDSVSDASSSADLQTKVKKNAVDQEFKRSFVQPSPLANDYQRPVDAFGAPLAPGQPQYSAFNAAAKSNAADAPASQQPRKPGQQVQSFFREDGPRPNFQGQIPVLRPQQNHFETVVEQRPLEFKDNQQSRPQFNSNQPNYLHLNNQPNVQQFTNQPINHQQFTNPQNHQQFTNQQTLQQFTNQQTLQQLNNQQLNNQQSHQQFNNQQNLQQLNNLQNHQQLSKQQSHQQFINQPNPQQLNNQQNHQHFTNHQNHQQLISQPSHQQIISQPSHQQLSNNQQSHQKLNNQQSHLQFVNQQRPQDFQAGPPPLRNPASFQERPAAQIKSNNERPLITQPFENLSLQNKPFETRPPQERPFDSRPFESRPVPERSLENRPAFDRPFENRPNPNRPPPPPFDNRHNQPTFNRPNKPPPPQNIPLNPNPSFVPSDKRPTVPPPPLPSAYNTQPLGTKHTVDLAFSPHQQQQQHQQFQKQQFQQQQFQQQYRPADARPPPAGNGPAASFVQHPTKQQQQPTKQFAAEVQKPVVSQYQQQQYVADSRPSQIPQLQITQSNSFKLEPEFGPAQSGQFFETYNGDGYPPQPPSTQTEQTFHFDHGPWQVSSQPQGSAFRNQAQHEYRDYSTTSTVRSDAPELPVTSTRPAQHKTTEKPAAATYATQAQYRERTTAPSITTTAAAAVRTTSAAAATYGGPVAGAAAGNGTTGKTADFKTFASLPDEVPDELREQLLSSGILSNADIQILDYDKVGDIPIENLPPEALENLYGQGSAPVPSIALPPPGKSSGVQMKVVKYDPATEEGRRVEAAYVGRPKAQTLPPVVLNDTGYNRFLPLNIDGAHFPIPDSPLLRNKAIGSVVILSPVGYDVSDDQSRPSRNAAVKVKGVHFVVGDVVKDLVRDPSRRNFESWLDKEKDTPPEEQSVVLLVTK